MKLTAAARPWTRIRAESKETEYDYECWSDGAPPPRPLRSAPSWTRSRQPTAPDFLEPPRLVDWPAPPAPESSPRLSVPDVPSRTAIREGEPSLPPDAATPPPPRSPARAVIPLVVLAAASAALGAWIARGVAAPRPVGLPSAALSSVTNGPRSLSPVDPLERPPIAWSSPAPSLAETRRVPQAVPLRSELPARHARPTRAILGTNGAPTSAPARAQTADAPGTPVPATARAPSAGSTRATSEQAAAELGSSLLTPNAVGTQATSACQ